MFKHLDKRIQRDIKKMTDYRLKLTEESSHGKLKVQNNYCDQFDNKFDWFIDLANANWRKGRFSQYAAICRLVWRVFVGFYRKLIDLNRFSVVFDYVLLIIIISFSQDDFYTAAHTKKQYDEVGPSICRHNPVFGRMT